MMRALLCSLLLMLMPQVKAEQVDDQLKAMFIYNFSNFVEWPQRAFANHRSPLRICLYGQVPFSPMMTYFDGTPVRDRRLQIESSLDKSQFASGCHILYVGIDRQAELESFFKNLNHMFVFSVGNTEGFVQSGGILNILRTQDQAQFEIDLNKALSSGLQVSSDLLELARIINSEM